ncbi:hypothetical protein DFP72DRAFT_901615 [Ephemerocybe angulata]|uniref:MYND-type domain-containing protein n=1 Tax=Ephemerocybe angulata TaxID=980116 RepID=A0A8H6M6S2_9AGAR|nr:hypothetical protein DFP72DRAFT_901615 [Tulosesus angulatus]
MPPKGNVGHVKPQSTHDQSHRKAEALLNAAERGSIPHLERLQLEWPADTSLAQRAMTILLGNLKAEAHHIPRLESQAPDKELQRSLDIALASLAGLNGALGPLDSGPEMQAKQIVATFHPYLEYYLAWLRFTLVKPHLAMPPQPISPGLQAATRLGTLMEVGMHMTEDPEILERIVDLSLLIFTADSQPVAIFTQEQYDTLVAPKLNPLGLCLRPNTPTREALYNKLNSWNTRSLKRLFEVFHREFLECSAGIPKNTPGVNCTTLSSYVFFTLSLSSRLPRFCKIMMKSGFPTLAVKAALDVRLAPARNLPRGPMSLEISTVLFNRQILLVDYSRRLVTQVLKAGILEIIVDDLLAPRDKGEVFDEWKFDEYVGHPLGALLCASYDRHIANALNTAIMSLSPTTTRNIALNDSARRIWGPFLHDFQLHQAALRQFSDDRIPICDSLLHHAVTKAGALQGTPKECSTCRTTVYCSIDCQREDWDTLHRYECTRRRVELIDRQLTGTSISHRTRVFNLLHLEAIMNRELRHRLGSGRHKGMVCIFDRTVHPMSVHCDAIENPALYKRLQFHDARSRAMLRQVAEDDSGILAVCVSASGRCGVATVARFTMGPSMALQLQGGFCRVSDVKE